MIDTEKYLSTFFKGTKDPSLDAMEYFMNHFEWCCDKLKIIHIAGTNGKGSCLETMTNILVKQGYKVGKFLSPHLIKYNERISINNIPISDEELSELIEELQPLVAKYNMEHNVNITLFELETTMAFVYFYRKNVDFVVLETGLGGIYDCTNIITKPLVSIITSIGYDHMHLLGNTLPEIAYQKAGIIKENSNTVFFMQEPEVNRVFEEKCKKEKNNFYLITPNQIKNYHYDDNYQYFDFEDYKNIEVLLKGKKQINNTTLCIKTAEILNKLGFLISREAIYEGIKTVVHKARMETLLDSPKIIYDGAHNTSAMENFLNSIGMYYKNYKRTYIVSILTSKDHEKMIEILSKDKEARFIFTSGNDETRYNSKSTLLDCFKKFRTNEACAMELEEAIKMIFSEKQSEKEATFIIGSFYVYGDILQFIKKYK